MSLPSQVQKCRNCGTKFAPAVPVEALPVFNTVDKSQWAETTCPACKVSYRVARLSKNSTEVMVVLSRGLPPKESMMIEVRLPPMKFE